jgi:hypothetical protein
MMRAADVFVMSYADLIFHNGRIATLDPRDTVVPAEGQIALMVAGVTRTCRPGEVFTPPSGCRHVEDIGTDGGRYLMGKRRATAA